MFHTHNTDMVAFLIDYKKYTLAVTCIFILSITVPTCEKWVHIRLSKQLNYEACFILRWDKNDRILLVTSDFVNKVILML